MQIRRKIAAAAFLASVAIPALAQTVGGNGGAGTGGGGGAGEGSSAASAGMAGSNGFATNDGGGGGGAGTVGAAGGLGAGAYGGAGSGDPYDSGTAGGPNSGGGGGAGGNHGAVITTTSTNSGTVTGGFGGGGGGGGTYGGGGGGGAGGYGVVINGAGIIYTNNSIIAAGVGGQGGAAMTAGATGGNGGGGGYGVDFNTAATLVNTGWIYGGDGGRRGGAINGASAGLVGPGGQGVVGNGITIVNSGTISGGLDGDGVARADAIQFLGGGNTLTLQSGSVINGNVELDGASTLTFNQAAAQTLSNAITGSGSIFQNGIGTLTLTAANTYTGGTTISAGALNVLGSTSASTTTLQSCGTLEGIGNVGSVTVQSGGAMEPGNSRTSIGTLTVNGNLTLAPGATYSALLGCCYAGGWTFAQTAVTGAADIAGNLSLDIQGYLGIYAHAGEITLISSGGLLSGSFSNVDASGLAESGFHLGGISYDANDVYLNIVRDTFVWSVTPATSDWATFSNWQNGAVPDFDVAYFGATSRPTITIGPYSAPVGSLVFEAGAPDYIITIANPAATPVPAGFIYVPPPPCTGDCFVFAPNEVVDLTDGIVDHSSNPPRFLVGGVNEQSDLNFVSDGNAADAIITAEAFGTVAFKGNSDAGPSATLITTSGGFFDFSLTSGPNGDNRVSAGSIAGPGYFVLGNNNLTVGTLNTSTEVSGVISGDGGSLTKVGTGTLTLSGNNTYTAGTTIAAGTLSISADDNLGNGGGVTIDAGSTLTFTATGTYSHAVTLAGDPGLDVAAGQSVTYSGVIADGASPGTLQKTDSGTLILAVANSYTGGTDVAAGTLSISSDDNLGNGGAVAMDAGTTLAFTATGNYGHTVTLTGDPIFDVASGQTITYTGVIADGASAGTLEKTDGGTLILAAANTYTGGTTVAAGMLQTTGPGTLGASSGSMMVAGGALDLGGTTQTQNGGVTISSGAIQNGILVTSGTFTLQGGTVSAVLAGSGEANSTGNVALTAANTYTGGTDVTAGILTVMGSLVGPVTVNGGRLSGTGSVGAVNVSSSGTLAPGISTTIIGTLTATENLSLAAGSITDVEVSPSAADQIAVDGAASISGTLNATFASGAYVPAQYTLITSTNELSGIFSAYNAAGLPTNFSSALSYDAHDVYLVLSSGFSASTTANVNSGIVTLTSNETTGGLASSGPGGTLDISNGSALIDNQNSNTIFSGDMTGNGSFTKSGTGTLILDGTSNYTGGTTISGGTLEVGDVGNPGASISGPVTVESGGTLQGHGTIGGAVFIGSGGNLQPGGTIGTIRVGSATFAPGSTYTVETSGGGQADLTIATSTILINNGTTLAVTPDLPLDSYGRSTTYTILEAAGGITGTFSSITSTAASLVPSVTYSSDSVALTLLRPDLIAAAGVTANQKSVGAALDAAGIGAAPILAVLGPQSNAGIQQSDNELSGDIHASLRSVMIEDGKIIRDTVINHAILSSHNMTVWGASFGSYGTIESDGNAADIHHNDSGVMVGADMPAGHGVNVGLGVALTDQHVSAADVFASASGTTNHLIGYANWTDTQWLVSLGWDYAWGVNEVARQITALSETDSDHQTNTLGQVFGEVGYRISSGGVRLEPYLDIANVEARTAAFSETGGIAALNGGAKSDSENYATLGVRATLPAFLVEGITMVPDFNLGWQYAYTSFATNQTLVFANTGESFVVNGVPLETDAVAIQVGLDFILSPAANLDIGYDGDIADRVEEHAIRANLRWEF